MLTADVLTLHIFTWSSVTCILAYLFFRGHRSYLLYLGAGFMCVTLVLLSAGITRWIVGFATLAAFIMAFIEGASDMQERVRKLREELKEREQAFSDLQLALIEQEKAREEQAAEPPAPRDDS